MSTTSQNSAAPSVLVISAHSGDFVWRAGGAIALTAHHGSPVHVLCLSYGERGESRGLWKQEGMTVERVKQARHEEAAKAAEVLGATIEFLDLGDYPLRVEPGWSTGSPASSGTQARRAADAWPMTRTTGTTTRHTRRR